MTENPALSTVCVVVCGSISRQGPLQSLKELGCKLICINDSVMPWAENAKYFQHWIISDISNHELTIKRTDEFLIANNITFDAIICYDEFGVNLSSLLATHLGLPFIPTNTVLQVRNKYSFRQACNAKNIPGPKILKLDLNWQKFRVFRDSLVNETQRQPCCELRPDICTKCQIFHWAFSETPIDPSLDNPLAETLSRLKRMFAEADVHFPVVVKPTHGAGKMFVRKVDSFVDLMDNIYNFVVHNMDYMTRFYLSEDEASGIFLEEFLLGTEVDVDCIVQSGRILFCSINSNRVPLEPWFLELGGSVPAALSAEQQLAIRDLTQKVLNVFDDTISGIVHFEAKIDGLEVKPIELNLRLGGAETYVLVKGAYEASDCISCGVDLIGSQVDLIRELLWIQLGIDRSAVKYPALDEFKKYASSVNIVPGWHSNKAILSTFTSSPQLLTHQHYGGHAFFHPAGYQLMLPPEGAQYLGWIVALGDTREAAETSIVELEDMVDYQLADVTSS